MRKQLKIAFIMVPAAMACVAALAQSALLSKRQHSPQQIAERKAEFIRKTGGFIRKPKSGTGKIVFVNAQRLYGIGEVSKVAEVLGREYRIDIETKEGSFTTIGGTVAAVKDAGGTAGVIVAEVDPSFPALMVFPDERCAIVNVSAFPKGGGVSLLRKQVVRGMAAAAGAMTSQINPTLMSSFENQKKLSLFPNEEVPADVVVRVKNALRYYGVTPYVVTTYKHACREGWAPQPTNDVQKAIWDEIHAMPTEPIKIKPEAKKVSD